MSAAEKLKALGEGLLRERIAEHIAAEGWNPDRATPQKLEDVSRQLRLAAYDAVLPQIVAVVEAAELYAEVLDDAHLMELSLAALDEALTKTVHTDSETKA